jgi:hypothetical protein
LVIVERLGWNWVKAETVKYFPSGQPRAVVHLDR